jgi:hypothetical protein
MATWRASKSNTGDGAASAVTVRWRWIAPNAITLIHRDGCPLIATLPTLPEGGHLAATWIAWPEESRP